MPSVPIGYTIVYAWHAIDAVVVGNKTFQSGLHPFVESFEQCNSKGIFYAEVFGLVVNRVITKLQSLIIIGVLIIISWGVIRLIDAVIIIYVESMYEAGYWHILALHCSIY